ncbi:MAG: hypothetical protein IT370_33755 [Deltaproteobacteria bacterium]|nr:hypothetical protein [Deltaproteobacteria bacterium]
MTTLARAWPARVTLACAAAAGCSFDSSGVRVRDAAPDDGGPGDGGPGDGGPGDGGPDGGGADAGCSTDLTLVVRVNGQVKSAGGTPTPVLLGDTVALDTEGSCSPFGPITVTWSLTPAGNLLPGPTAPAISAVAAEATTYVARVQASVAGPAPIMRMVDIAAFRAAPFVELVALGAAARNDVNDVDLGAGRLWVATDDGAMSAPLTSIAPPSAMWQDVAGGAPFSGGLPTNTRWRSVFFHPRSPRAYFGAVTANDFMRVDCSDAAAPVRNVFDFAVAFTSGTPPTVFAMAPQVGEQAALWLATSRGVLPFDAAGSFGAALGPLGDFTLEAVVEVGAPAPRNIAASNDLYDLLSNASTSLLAGDDKVRDLAWDGARSLLWAATDGNGLYGDQLAPGGMLTQIYGLTMMNSALASNDIRSLAVDAGGDVWMATSKGAARFKRDRAQVIVMAAPAGVAVDDTRAIAIDPVTRRVFLGTKGRGVLVLEVR